MEIVINIEQYQKILIILIMDLFILKVLYGEVGILFIIINNGVLFILEMEINLQDNGSILNNLKLFKTNQMIENKFYNPIFQKKNQKYKHKYLLQNDLKLLYKI